MKKKKIQTCFKFEEYMKDERETTEKNEGVVINGDRMETGGVYGKGLMQHLEKSTEFKCGSKVPNHRNVIKMLDFGITKTIFGDYFFCLGLPKASTIQ